MKKLEEFIELKMDLKKKKKFIQNITLILMLKVIILGYALAISYNVFLGTDYGLWASNFLHMVYFGFAQSVVIISWIILSTLGNKKKTIIDNKSPKTILSIILLAIISDILIICVYLCYLQYKFFDLNHQYLWSNIGFGIMIITLLIIVNYIGMLVWKNPKEIINNLKTGKYKPKLTKKERKQARVFKFLIVLLGIMAFMMLFCAYQVKHDVEHAGQWDRYAGVFCFAGLSIGVMLNFVSNYFRKKNNGKDILKKL